MRLSIPALIAALAAGLLPAHGVRAADGPPSIIVQGEASVSVVPDMAIISLGVVTERPKAAEAFAQNNGAVAGVLEAVKAMGVEARDVSTGAIGLSAVYGGANRDAPAIKGFRATNTIQIRVRSIDKAGPLVGALVDKGINSIDGIEFAASPDTARDDALRGAAMRDARHKAQVYVEALGLKLGRVLAITPSNPRPQMHAYRMAAAAAATPAALSAGEEQQRAEVSVTYEILQ
jgi:uncharacterized protein YggE